MKNFKVLSTICMSAILIVMGVCYFTDTPTLDEQVFLDNVEALAGGDASTEQVKCYCKTHWFSPNVCSANADGAYCGGNPCSNHDGNCR